MFVKFKRDELPDSSQHVPKPSAEEDLIKIQQERKWI